MKRPDHLWGGGEAFAAAAAAAAVILCLTAAAPTWAATVTYSTTGTFTGAGANGSSLTSDGGTGTAVLSFAGITDRTVQVNPPPVQQISLGTFTLSEGDYFDFLAGSFGLVVSQSAPSDGIGEASASLLLGVVSKRSGGAALFFEDPTFTIGNVTYSVNPLVLVPVGSAELQGTLRASVVPLPVTVWSGMALMGTVGMVKLRQWMSRAA